MNNLQAAGFIAPSVIQPLTPAGPGWTEIPATAAPTLLRDGYPFRIFVHKTHLQVISAVEVANDQIPPKGPEYHISISRLDETLRPYRCTSAEATWVLRQFNLDGAEEDNHVPDGVVRNFWRPVAEPLVGLECVCKAEEPAIVEDKGDFVWRPTK